MMDKDVNADRNALRFSMVVNAISAVGLSSVSLLSTSDSSIAPIIGSSISAISLAFLYAWKGFGEGSIFEKNRRNGYVVISMYAVSALVGILVLIGRYFR
jgi:hypothetical protein